MIAMTSNVVHQEEKQAGPNCSCRCSHIYVLQVPYKLMNK